MAADERHRDGAIFGNGDDRRLVLFGAEERGDRANQNSAGAEAEDWAASGEERQVELEVLYNFYMSGIGYFHPRWGHGMWVGRDESTYESFKTAEVDEHDMLFQHIQAVSRARIDQKPDGMGILEMIILGPHQPSGFKEFMDWHG